MLDREKLAGRFNLLLALLVAVFVFAPFFETRGLAAEVGRIAVELTLVSAVWILRPGRFVPALVTGIMVLNELAHWLARWSPEPVLIVTGQLLSLLFLAVTGGFISWIFWTDRRVGAGILAGAVSVYLLLGYFWATAFALLEYAEPGSFAGVCSPRPEGGIPCDPVLARFPRLFYFGFVTLTTLGYGDMVPLTVRAEGLSTLAALSGQLFLAVLIGRLVGAYVNREPELGPFGRGQ